MNSTALPNRPAKKPFFIYLLLLVALGSQTMLLELSIPRMIAPAFGNTLFSWTAIIAVVLFALAIGYELGGRFANTINLEKKIAAISFVAALWVAGLSYFGARLVDAFADLGIMFGPLFASFLLAAFPSVLTASVVPLVAQLSHYAPGKASGTCFSWSTAGSIIGVLCTGYLLMPLLGIKGTLLVGSSLTLLILFFVVPRYSMVGLVFIAFFAFIDTPSNDSTLFATNNGYHSLRIKTAPGGLRYLLLDSTIEGAIRPGSAIPVLDYHKRLRQILLELPPLRNALFIGGGSFSMPRYTKLLAPNAGVSVIELDPDVIRAARDYLELADDINIHIGDGRQQLRSLPEQYDLIVNDAFHGVRQIPFHLLSVEFNNIVKARLSATGVYAINIIGHPTYSDLVRSVIKTVRASFPYTSVFYKPTTKVSNIWLLASLSRITIGTPSYEEVDKGTILTDNHAPVEYLVAKELLR